MLHSATGVSEASYRPAASDLYVRVSASRESGAARCLSQPVWIVR